MMSSVDSLLAEGGDSRAERYVMQVVANCASDVVRLAGGAIFDRALCGWDVAVYLPTGAAERAISILGARVVDLSAQVSMSQTSSMNRSQMRKSLSGKLIQQTDSTRTRARPRGPSRVRHRQYVTVTKSVGSPGRVG